MWEPDREQFKESMVKEVKDQMDNSKLVMPTVWQMKCKRDIITRTINKWKARLNIDGSKMIQGTHNEQLYSHEPTWNSIQTMLIGGTAQMANGTNRLCTGIPASPNQISCRTIHAYPSKSMKQAPISTTLTNRNSSYFFESKKYSNGVIWKCSIEGQPNDYSGVALECFTKELLVGEMTCDHQDCNRDNNCMVNLSAKGHLFQCNNKKSTDFLSKATSSV
jgi:hypothetical protein